MDSNVPRPTDPNDPNGDLPSPPPLPRPPSPGDPIDPERARLELEKLRAEIKQAEADADKSTTETAYLKRSWYRKSAVLQPLAVIVATISGTVLLDVNGFFDTKLASLKMQQQESSNELKALNERKSALNIEIDALVRERDDLNQKYNQSISQVERLQSQYKDATTKAIQGERYRRQAAEAQKQLQKTIAEANVAREAAEAAKWHEGDNIRILLLDAKTKKPVTGYLALLPGKPWNIQGRFSHALGPPEGKGFLNRQITGTDSMSWDVKFVLLDDRFVYSVSKRDVTASSIQITFFAPGYENTLVSVPAGVKILTVYLNPEPAKGDAQIKTDSSK